MSFTSMAFLGFFALALPIFWLVPRRLRGCVLLAANLFYIASWGSTSLLALGGVTLLGYGCGYGISHAQSPQTKRIWLVLGLAGSAGWLFARKLLGFAPAFSPVEAVGLAFYGLQAAGYLVDVFHGQPPAKNLFRFALFLTFFPHVLSGPVGRFETLGPQVDALAEGRSAFSPAQAEAGLTRMICGYTKKLILADTLNVVINNVYGSYTEQPGSVLALATVLFAFSLYYDFAGYSDIAIGAAQLLGIQLQENFARPYLAISMRDFWRRWHISLSSWLQRYIYIPLGGSRRGRLCKWRNLVLTFLVSGLWHGTGWQYFVWGLLHAFYQICEDAFPSARTSGRLVRLLRQGLAFLLADLAWLFFRAESLPAAAVILGRIFTAFMPRALVDGTLLTLGLARVEWAAVLLVLLAELLWESFAERCAARGQNAQDRFHALPGLLRWAFWVCLAVMVLLFACRTVGGDASAFYYAQF